MQIEKQLPGQCGLTSFTHRFFTVGGGIDVGQGLAGIRIAGSGFVTQVHFIQQQLVEARARAFDLAAVHGLPPVERAQQAGCVGTAV